MFRPSRGRVGTTSAAIVHRDMDCAIVVPHQEEEAMLYDAKRWDRPMPPKPAPTPRLLAIAIVAIGVGAAYFFSGHYLAACTFMFLGAAGSTAACTNILPFIVAAIREVF